jgi:hypothetical protein
MEAGQDRDRGQRVPMTRQIITRDEVLQWNSAWSYTDRETIEQHLDRLYPQSYYVPPSGGYVGCVDACGHVDDRLSRLCGVQAGSCTPPDRPDLDYPGLRCPRSAHTRAQPHRPTRASRSVRSTTSHYRSPASATTVSSLPGITFQGMRHSFVAILVAAGCNVRDVSEWARHNVAFTLTWYGGLFEDGSDGAVDRLDALLGRADLRPLTWSSCDGRTSRGSRPPPRPVDACVSTGRGRRWPRRGGCWPVSRTGRPRRRAAASARCMSRELVDPSASRSGWFPLVSWVAGEFAA